MIGQPLMGLFHNTHYEGTDIQKSSLGRYCEQPMQLEFGVTIGQADCTPPIET